MNTSTVARPDTNGLPHALDLELVVTDQAVLAYLVRFDDDDTQCEKALEALKVGVIAIQSASPTLDTQVVQSKFTEVEGRMKEQLADFQTEVKEELCRYFEEDDGTIPRTIDGTFGEGGSLARTFQAFFDPTEGRLCRLMQTQIGPESAFGRALDPENKQGVVALVEARIQELVEAQLDEVLQQFSLDEDGSAMSRLNAMLTDFFARLNQSLGIKAATAEEAAKGHVKGIEFEQDLYDAFAELGRHLGDDTDLVRGTVGRTSRCKKGDYLATLADSSGAPGTRIVVEVKDQPVRLKDAIDELQQAKENRDATVGIYVFAYGSEPPEVGDFRRIGEDFYCTVDKDDLRDAKPLLFFDSAFKIARAFLAIASKRKDASGELDLQRIEDQVDALAAWSDQIADMARKARTIQNSGKLIEQVATELKQELDTRLATILDVLKREESP